MTPEFRHGTPCWTDLAASDVPAAKEFYGRVFGWEPGPDLGPESGGYGFFMAGSAMAAGVGPVMMEGAPPNWASYVWVDDAAAALQRAAGAGGAILAGPMQVMGAGTMGFFTDPTGAALGVWQPDEHRGAQNWAADNGFSWIELATTDTEPPVAFYREVFGWEAKLDPGYTEFTVDGRSVAGMFQMGEEMAGIPSHWMPYVQVADVDATMAAAESAGGKIVKPAETLPGTGRFGCFLDPQGVGLSVIKLEPGVGSAS